MKYVKATLRNDSFVFPADKLLSVLDGETVSTVPFAPVNNLGIMKYQDEIIPVFDSLLGVNSSARLLLVLKKEDHIFACTADQIDGFTELNDEELSKLRDDEGSVYDGLVLLKRVIE